MCPEKFLYEYKKLQPRDIGSISNLEGHDTSRALFSSEKGDAF